jgi:hypothetical protein
VDAEGAAAVGVVVGRQLGLSAQRGKGRAGHLCSIWRRTLVVILVVHQPRLHKVFDSLLQQPGVARRIDSGWPAYSRRRAAAAQAAPAPAPAPALTSRGGLLPVSQM